MSSPKKDQANAAPTPKAVRRSGDAPIAEMGRVAKAPEGTARANNPRKPPSNARVIQDSYKTGTVSRAAARAAAKRASGIV